MTSQDTLPEPYNSRVRDAYAIIAGIPASRINLAKFLASRNSVYDPSHPVARMVRAGGRGLSRKTETAMRISDAVAHDCGTFACMGGWLALHPDFRVGRVGEYGVEFRSYIFGPKLARIEGVASIFAYRGGCMYDSKLNRSDANDKQVALNRLLRALGWNAQDARERAMQDGAE